MTTRNTRLRNSTYTPEQELRFETLLSAFSGYIDRQDFFEVMYSEKLGKYIWVVMEKLLWRDEPVREIESPDELFRLFVGQIGVSVASSRWDTEYEEAGPEFNFDELAEMQRQVMEYLPEMPDAILREHYIGELERFIAEESARAARYEIREKKNSITQKRRYEG